ncbi:MAG: DHH family phosphoesterase [bacterium]
MWELDKEKLEIKKILDESNIILLTMSSPDGDSIGSSLALKFILEQLGKTVEIVCSFDLAGRFNNYIGSSSIIISDLGRVDFNRYDCCFTLDAGHISRLVRSEFYPNGFKFPKSLKVINIDHHQSNDLFGTLNINVKEASCTAEVLETLFEGEYMMDSTIGKLLFYSVVYDTVNFRHNVTAHMMEFALKCLKSGINAEEVISEFFNNRSLIQTKYEGVLLERMIHKDNYVCTFAYHDDIEKYGIDVAKYLSATATIARDYISAFKDADFGWVISERRSNVVKLEMRGKIEDTPILEITQSLGGGGHKKACGAKIIDKSIEEVQDYIIKYLS